jgi:redox-sensitive bicupin YhaK (pirin superfamily)
MLRVLNDDTVAPGTGFSKHPHDNMEIITLVMKGALEHKDSMGHTQAIVPGEVQVMSAGTGLVHSEYNHSHQEPVSFFQVWIFPGQHNVEPRYDQRAYAEEGRHNRLQLLVAPMNTEEDSLKIHQQAWVYRATCATDTELSHTLHIPGNGVYLFVVEGTAEVEGQMLSRRDGLGIADVRNLIIKAGAGCDLLVFEIPMQ